MNRSGPYSLRPRGPAASNSRFLTSLCACACVSGARLGHRYPWSEPLPTRALSTPTALARPPLPVKCTHFFVAYRACAILLFSAPEILKSLHRPPLGAHALPLAHPRPPRS